MVKGSSFLLYGWPAHPPPGTNSFFIISGSKSFTSRTPQTPMLCTKLTIFEVKINNVKKLNYVLPHKRLTTLNSRLPLEINSRLLSGFLNQFSFQLILCPVDNIMFADQLQCRQTWLFFLQRQQFISQIQGNQQSYV